MHESAAWGLNFQKNGEEEMANTDNRGYVKRAMAGFWALLMVSAAALAESKFLSLCAT
jgi:hypothetical protein